MSKEHILSKEGVNWFFFFIKNNFNLWRPLLIITFYYHIKISIGFWYRRKLNIGSLIQPLDILPVELTRTHNCFFVINEIAVYKKLKKNQLNPLTFKFIQFRSSSHCKNKNKSFLFYVIFLILYFNIISSIFFFYIRFPFQSGKKFIRFKNQSRYFFYKNRFSHTVTCIVDLFLPIFILGFLFRLGKGFIKF